jgi:hypothetical protein
MLHRAAIRWIAPNAMHDGALSCAPQGTNALIAMCPLKNHTNVEGLSRNRKSIDALFIRALHALGSRRQWLVAPCSSQTAISFVRLAGNSPRRYAASTFSPIVCAARPLGQTGHLSRNG